MWSDMPFAVIDPSAMTKELREYQTKTNKTHEGVAGNLVAGKLTAIVEE
jgi:hypothetical protein